MNFSLRSWLREFRRKVEIDRLNRLSPRTEGLTHVTGGAVEFVDAPSFLSSFEAIYLRKVYHFVEPSGSPRILDCGANIGLATLYFLQQFEKPRITAFEPDPRIFQILKKNARGHRSEGLQLIESAVSTSDQPLRFLPDGSDGGRVAEDGESTIEIPACRLRDFLDEQIDFLKMDIEGAEFDVIHDCQDRLGNVKRLFVECHCEGSTSRLADLLSTLSSSGFNYHIFSRAEPVKPFAHVHCPIHQGQLLEVFAERAPLTS